MFEFPPIDFEEFHEAVLPARLAGGNGALAGPDVARVEPIGFTVPDGPAYTYVPTDGTIEVQAGIDRASTVVEMTRAAWSDYAHELRTCFGLLYADALRFVRGTFEGLVRWEPAIRAMYSGRPLYDPTWVEGLGLDRSFTLDDTDDDLRAHLDAAGFLHVRGVFSADEIAALVTEVQRRQAVVEPGDRHSWWAGMPDGREVCCRLIYLGLISPVIAALADDARLARLAALSGLSLVAEQDCLDGITVVIKQPGAVSGLADLPWHQDCGLGGHPVLCPSVAVGIQLDAATADSGQLHFLAGSHRGSVHQLRPGDERRLRTVALDTEPGDVTVHYGHVLHAAPEPTGRGQGRRALYVTFTRPETIAFVGPMRGYNDVLFVRDGAVHSVDELIG